MEQNSNSNQKRICYFCGMPAEHLTQCPYCKEYYCDLHILKENHDCPLVPIADLNPYEITEDLTLQDDAFQENMDNYDEIENNASITTNITTNITTKNQESQISGSSDIENDIIAEPPSEDKVSLKNYFKCPNCGTTISKNLTKCRKCNEDLNPSNWLIKAQLLQKQGDLEKSLDYLNAASVIDPKNNDIWRTMGSVYEEFYIYLQNKQKDIKILRNILINAANAYENLIKNDPSPENDPIRFTTAKIYIKLGIDNKVVKNLADIAQHRADQLMDWILEANFEDYHAWELCSNAFKLKNKILLAEKCAIQAKKLSPNKEKKTIIDLGGK
ncbi:MAG: hypothetical protein ACTSU2_07390 [Promethearchaeota archaeon]